MQELGGLKQERRRPGMPTDQASSQSDDGWMEAWISCALNVRQREVKEKAVPPANERSQHNRDHRFGANDDHNDNGTGDTTGHDPSGRYRSRPGGEHDARALSPSTREGEGRSVPLLPSVARPRTSCPHPRKSTRQHAPARPRSATGAIGRRSGGGGVQLAGAGKKWSREISERTTAPRPTSAPTVVKPRQAHGGGYLRPGGAGGRARRGSGGVRQTASSRKGQRRASRDGQVRVQAAWSYGSSKRNGRAGSPSFSRQILVKVPCVSTNNGGGGGGGTKSTRRARGVAYRLAWNDEVRKHTDAVADSSEGKCALEGHAGGLRLNDEAPRTATATVSQRHRRPKETAAGLTVQLPRPMAGDEVSSTTPGGNGGLGHGNSSFGCSLLSTSDSEWGPHQQQQQQLQQQPDVENRSSTSRVIANLRASVACVARPSSTASVYNSSFFSAAPISTGSRKGSGAVPIDAGLEETQGGTEVPGRRTVWSSDVGPYNGHKHDGVRPKERPRPQSAAASSAAGRTSLSAGVGAAEGGRRHGVTTTSARRATTKGVNLFEHDAAGGKAVAATRRWPLEGKRGGTTNTVGNQRQNGPRRPKSAAAGTSGADRRGRAVRATMDYSFFPSPPAAAGTVAESRPLFDGDGHAQPVWPGEPSKGDVSEWEGPLCSNAADEAGCMGGGCAFDSSGTWREAVGIWVEADGEV